MTVYLVIVGTGLGILIILAVVVAQLESRSQSAAWRAIARTRRELADWEGELIAAAESRGCAACRLLRRRAELLDH